MLIVDAQVPIWGRGLPTNQPRTRAWPTDGTIDWLWPAAERAGLPVALANISAGVAGRAA